MDEPNKASEGRQESAGAPESQRKPAEKPESHSPLEPVYQNFQDVPLKYVDIFIWICVAALILVVVFGILKGNGII